jgi:hypothetical protein
LRLPTERVPDTTLLVDDAVPATETFPANVDAAVVEVAMKLLLVVLGTTTQVLSLGGQLGFRVWPGWYEAEATSGKAPKQVNSTRADKLQRVNLGCMRNLETHLV